MKETQKEMKKQPVYHKKRVYERKKGQNNQYPLDFFTSLLAEKEKSIVVGDCNKPIPLHCTAI